MADLIRQTRVWSVGIGALAIIMILSLHFVRVPMARATFEGVPPIPAPILGFFDGLVNFDLLVDNLTYTDENGWLKLQKANITTRGNIDLTANGENNYTGIIYLRYNAEVLEFEWVSGNTSLSFSGVNTSGLITINYDTRTTEIIVDESLGAAILRVIA